MTLRQLFLLQLNDGNRAEKCYSWAVTYLSLTPTHIYTRTRTHTRNNFQDKTHRMPGAVFSDADLLPDTYKCMQASVVRSWCFLISWLKLTVDVTCSSLLFHLPMIALDFFTTTVMLSVYLECSLIQGQAACHPQVQVSPSHVDRHMLEDTRSRPSAESERERRRRDRDPQEALSVQLC